MKTYENRTQEVVDKVVKKRKIRKSVAITAPIATVCILSIIVSLVLFLPFQNEVPTDSPYQGVISKLAPRLEGYHNNYEKLSAYFQPMAKTSGMAVDMANSANYAVEDAAVAPNSSKPKGDQGYIENTNVQVKGVKEGDLLKESTDYFYYLHFEFDEKEENEEEYYGYYYYYYLKQNYGKLRLDIYDKNGKDSKVVASFSFAPENEHYYRWNTKEMYLSDDCNTLTVVADWYGNVNEYTVVTTIDISDFENINIVKEQYVTGNYRTSRMVDDSLLLVTDYYLSLSNVEFVEPRTFVPYVWADKKVDLIAPENLVIPDEVDSTTYCVVTSFDKEAQKTGQIAFFGYIDEVYANENHAYLAMNDNYYFEGGSYNRSRIICVSYNAEGLEKIGDFYVKGAINDQYSMDEKDGVFRVFVSVRDYVTVYDENYKYYYDSLEKINSSFYCFKVDTWEKIASVIYFAPKDETVRSVRFLGDVAYVCTAVQNRDPVFKFDLSDYNNITYISTKEISGFSMSLTPFTDDTLLGVGVGGDWSFKIELYKATEDEVISVADYTSNYESSFDVYKSYLIKADLGLLGIPVRNYGDDEFAPYYDLFTYRDGELKLAKAVKFGTGADMYDARAALANDYIYMFAGNELQVVALADVISQ